MNQSNCVPARPLGRPWSPLCSVTVPSHTMVHCGCHLFPMYFPECDNREGGWKKMWFTLLAQTFHSLRLTLSQEITYCVQICEVISSTSSVVLGFYLDPNTILYIFGSMNINGHFKLFVQFVLNIFGWLLSFLNFKMASSNIMQHFILCEMLSLV